MTERGEHGRWIGAPLPLKEGARLVAGRGRYVDDIARPRMLHAAMLRSPHPHARIVSIDTDAAAAMPGVVAVLTGAEAARLSRPIRPLIPTPVPVPDYCLAVDRARFAGEPIAAVAAVDRATAEDALERIVVEWEPLEAVVDPEAAIRSGGPLLYPGLGTNVIWHDTLTYGDVEGAFARHDCGRELNPLIVEGMVHGSTVHGIGAALLEEFRVTTSEDSSSPRRSWTT